MPKRFALRLSNYWPKNESTKSCTRTSESVFRIELSRRWLKIVYYFIVLVLWNEKPFADYRFGRADFCLYSDITVGTRYSR